MAQHNRGAPSSGHQAGGNTWDDEWKNTIHTRYQEAEDDSERQQVLNEAFEDLVVYYLPEIRRVVYQVTRKQLEDQAPEEVEEFLDFLHSFTRSIIQDPQVNVLGFIKAVAFIWSLSLKEQLPENE